MIARFQVKRILNRRSSKLGLFWDDSERLNNAEPVRMDWPLDRDKPRVGLVRDSDPRPYWTKFRRFLEANDIPYHFYEIHDSTWLEKAAGFDVIIWRPMNRPTELEEARRKIYLLEKKMGKICYPSYNEIRIYEDKIIQYELLKIHGFPIVETFISHSFRETKQAVRDFQYPVIHKMAVGSASVTVEKVCNVRQAERILRQAFSFMGRLNYWPYLRQKDIVYFQKFQPNNGKDIRIIVIGDYIQGYYRYVPQGEFRASGMEMGDYWREDLPPEAIRLAYQVSQKLNSVMLGVDMLQDPEDGSFHLIELSNFIQIDDSDEGKESGRIGVYVRQADGSFEFREGRVWAQELAMKVFMERRWLDRAGEKAE